MPIEIEPNPHRIETGRSWRDLPPQPPSTPPVRPQVMAASVDEAVARSWPWGRIAAGAMALAVGISVGAWAPWSGTAVGAGRSLAADALPETIVPDPRTTLTGWVTRYRLGSVARSRSSVWIST